MESVGPLMGTNKAAWAVKLLLMTVMSYQVDCGSFKTHSTAVCMFVDGIARLQLPVHPQRPSPINFIRDIAGVVKNHHKNQQCIAR